MARATVYHQFGSKVGLLGAVVEDFERRAALAALAELAERLLPRPSWSGRWSAPAATTGPPTRRWPGRWSPSPWPTRPPATCWPATTPAGCGCSPGWSTGWLRPVGSAAPPAHALDTLWLLTGFAAYDEWPAAATCPPAEAALLADLAESRL